MKKELLQVLAPLALSMLSINSAFATAELSNQTAENEWEPVEYCGQDLGSDTSVGKKYRLYKNLTCDQQVNSKENVVLTVRGKNTILDLNGHTIDCLLRGDEWSPYEVGVQMLGEGGQLLGSENGNVSGKIINCMAAVVLGGDKEAQEQNIQDIQIAKNNMVRRIDAEDNMVGFWVVSNNNLLEDNTAQRSQLAGFLLGELDGIVGLTQKSLIISPMPYKNNKFIGNHAFDNLYGFIDRNAVRYQLEMRADEVMAEEDYNLFQDNVAEFSYKYQEEIVCTNQEVVGYCPEGGVGFLIQGMGGKYIDNVATNNEVNGFEYNFYRPTFINFYVGQRALVEIRHNEAIRNGEHGFAATSFISTVTESSLRTGGSNYISSSNGAIFAHNIAKQNGSDSHYGGYDFYDTNGYCAAGISDLNNLNLYISNTARTANPACTQGEPIKQ